MFKNALKKTHFCLPCVFLAVLFVVTACSSPQSPPVTTGPDNPTGTVISVTITPDNSAGDIPVEKGKTKQFHAAVEVTGGAAQTVNWSVDGKGAGSTTAISDVGILTIDLDETAETLTVTATSTVDSAKKASVRVAVKNPGEGPQVTGVTISPKEVSVIQGKTQQFTVVVDGDLQRDESVAWTVTGKSSNNTAISTDGLLTVGADEAEDTELTVTVTSTYNDTMFDTAKVTVIKQPTVEAVWLVGIPDWDHFPKGTPMTLEADGTFTWEGEVTADAHFRFSLTDTALYDHIWNGNWYAPDTNGKPVVIGDNVIVYYPTNTSEGATSATDNAWTISAGYYKITLDTVGLIMTVSTPVVVTGVTVNGPNSAAVDSNTVTYTAIVAGHNNPGQGVTWSVTGNAKKAGTTISATGILTVASDEAAGTELTVTATSTVDPGKSGTKTITVSAAGSAPLDPVSKPALSNAGVVTWTYDADANVTGYSIRVYKDDVALAEGHTIPVDKGTYTKDIRSSIQASIQPEGTGSYTVTVTAMGNGTTFTTAEDSPKSDAKVFTQRTKVPSIWWDKNGYARWVNPDSDTKGYTIQLKKQTGGTGDFVNVGLPLNADRNTTQNPGNAYETVTDFDFVFAETLGTSTMDITDLYSFEVVAKGNGELVLDSLPVTSGSRMYSIFGNSRIWTIAKSNGVYVAGADDGKIAYGSSNGTVWRMSSQDIFSSDAVRGIAYNGTDTFVAVGSNGKVANSGDGSTWSQITGFGSTNFSSIAYGNSIFVAVGEKGTVWYSEDSVGTKWKQCTSWTLDPTSPPAQDILSIAYGNGNFVIVGKEGQASYSATGATWNWSGNIATGDKLPINSIAFGNGKFVALVNYIGDTWDPNQNWDVAVCVNNTSWSWEVSKISEWYDSGQGIKPWKKRGLESVIYNGTKFIIVGKVFTTTVASVETVMPGVAISDDGTDWKPVENDTGFYSGETITAAIGLGSGRVILAGPGKFTIASF